MNSVFSKAFGRSIGLLMLIFVLSGLTFCSGGPKYSEFRRLPLSGWAYGDTVSVTFPAADSVMTGMLCVALKHNDDYQFANLWIELTLPVADGSVRRDTVNIPMADVYGRWYGGGFGASFQLSDTVLPTVTLDMRRPLSVRHIMRVDTLRDIELIGLTFN